MLNSAADKDVSRTVCGSEFHVAGPEIVKTSLYISQQTSAWHYQVTTSGKTKMTTIIIGIIIIKGSYKAQDRLRGHKCASCRYSSAMRSCLTD